MNQLMLTIAGRVVDDPKAIKTKSGKSMTTVRVAFNPSRFDRKENQWVDGQTIFYSVNTFDALAEHVVASLKKGEPVIVYGSHRIRHWGENEDQVDQVIDAQHVGHDLKWGTSDFTKRESATKDEYVEAWDEVPTEEA